MTSYSEERLGELLSALRPVPEAWVDAAKGLPTTKERLDELVKRAQEDEEFRRRAVADPRRVLQEAEVFAHAENVEIIRRRLDNKGQEQK
jgi:hypothetical protein